MSADVTIMDPGGSSREPEPPDKNEERDRKDTIIIDLTDDTDLFDEVKAPSPDIKQIFDDKEKDAIDEHEPFRHILHKLITVGELTEKQFIDILDEYKKELNSKISVLSGSYMKNLIIEDVHFICHAYRLVRCGNEIEYFKIMKDILILFGGAIYKFCTKKSDFKAERRKLIMTFNQCMLYKFDQICFILMNLEIDVTNKIQMMIWRDIFEYYAVRESLYKNYLSLYSGFLVFQRLLSMLQESRFIIYKSQIKWMMYKRLNITRKSMRRNPVLAEILDLKAGDPLLDYRGMCVFLHKRDAHPEAAEINVEQDDTDEHELSLSWQPNIKRSFSNENKISSFSKVLEDRKSGKRKSVLKMSKIKTSFAIEDLFETDYLKKYNHVITIDDDSNSIENLTTDRPKIENSPTLNASHNNESISFREDLWIEPMPSTSSMSPMSISFNNDNLNLGRNIFNNSPPKVQIDNNLLANKFVAKIEPLPTINNSNVSLINDDYIDDNISQTADTSDCPRSTSSVRLPSKFLNFNILSRRTSSWSESTISTTAADYPLNTNNNPNDIHSDLFTFEQETEPESSPPHPYLHLPLPARPRHPSPRISSDLSITSPLHNMGNILQQNINSANIQLQQSVQEKEKPVFQQKDAELHADKGVNTYQVESEVKSHDEKTSQLKETETQTDNDVSINDVVPAVKSTDDQQFWNKKISQQKETETQTDNDVILSEILNEVKITDDKQCHIKEVSQPNETEIQPDVILNQAAFDVKSVGEQQHDNFNPNSLSANQISIQQTETQTTCNATLNQIVSEVKSTDRQCNNEAVPQRKNTNFLIDAILNQDTSKVKSTGEQQYDKLNPSSFCVNQILQPQKQTEIHADGNIILNQAVSEINSIDQQCHNKEVSQQNKAETQADNYVVRNQVARSNSNTVKSTDEQHHYDKINKQSIEELVNLSGNTCKSFLPSNNEQIDRLTQGDITQISSDSQRRTDTQIDSTLNESILQVHGNNQQVQDEINSEFDQDDDSIGSPNEPSPPSEPFSLEDKADFEQHIQEGHSSRFLIENMQLLNNTAPCNIQQNKCTSSQERSLIPTKIDYSSKYTEKPTSLTVKDTVVVKIDLKRLSSDFLKEIQSFQSPILNCYKEKKMTNQHTDKLKVPHKKRKRSPDEKRSTKTLYNSESSSSTSSCLSLKIRPIIPAASTKLCIKKMYDNQFESSIVLNQPTIAQKRMKEDMNNRESNLQQESSPPKSLAKLRVPKSCSASFSRSWDWSMNEKQPETGIKKNQERKRMDDAELSGESSETRHRILINAQHPKVKSGGRSVHFNENQQVRKENIVEVPNMQQLLLQRMHRRVNDSVEPTEIISFVDNRQPRNYTQKGGIFKQETKSSNSRGNQNISLPPRVTRNTKNMKPMTGNRKRAFTEGTNIDDTTEAIQQMPAKKGRPRKNTKKY